VVASRREITEGSGDIVREEIENDLA
jgi:hypothetical protein